MLSIFKNNQLKKVIFTVVKLTLTNFEYYFTFQQKSTISNKKYPFVTAIMMSNNFCIVYYTGIQTQVL